MQKLFHNVIQFNDIRLFYSINLRKSAVLFHHVMCWVSRLFDVDNFIVLVGVVLVTMAATGGNFRQAIVILALSQGITHLVKRLFARARPFVSLKRADLKINPPKDRYSFPSGHTNAAVALAIIVGMWQPLLIWPFGILAALCAVSRIYLGVHYPSDVLIGALIPAVIKLFI